MLIVLHQGAIGDFLIALPVIQSVREHLGATCVTAIASAPSARLAAGRSVVDRWLCPENLGLYRLFCRDLPVGKPLTSHLAEADAVFSFLGGTGHVVHDRLAELTAAPVVSIDPRPRESTRADRLHISRQWMDDIRQAGWDIAEPRPASIRFDRPPPSPMPRVLVHPGSGGVSKCWPLERFVELAESLPGTDVTWMLGPADARQARGLQDRSEPILFEPELDQAVTQMATYDLYIGNDSGITHLAAAIGLPTVAIFATPAPRLWRPLGDRVRLVAPDDVQDDMACVAVDGVLSAVKMQLSACIRCS